MDLESNNNNNNDDGIVVPSSLSSSTIVIDIYLIPNIGHNNNIDSSTNDISNNNNDGDDTTSVITNVLERAFSEQQILLDLAELGVQINTYLQQQHSTKTATTTTTSNYDDNHHQKEQQEQGYQWISGGDGPVFGIHCSSNSSSTSCIKNHIITIPHLRTIYKYDICIYDEWYLIGCIMNFFESTTTTIEYKSLSFLSNTLSTRYTAIAIECTDIDDGQILLIEGAQYIPNWMDDIGPIHCTHRCWYVVSLLLSSLSAASSNTQNQQEQEQQQQLRIQFIRPNDIISPTSITVYDAIQLLSLYNSNSNSVSSSSNHHHHSYNSNTIELASYEMEQVIRQKIHTCTMEGKQLHTTAIILPLSIVQLLQHRTDLLSTICQSFVHHIHVPIHNNNIKSISDYIHPNVCNNNDPWIWSTISLNRTSYAMIRTITSKPQWIQEDSIIPTILLYPSTTSTTSIEIKRYQRLCTIDSTPHLKYALQLGVRILAGIHHILTTTPTTTTTATSLQQSSLFTSTGNANQKVSPPQQSSSSMKIPLSHTEHRILYHWSRIINECCNRNLQPEDGMNWITQAWYAGPNESKYNIENMIHCPVVVPEIISSITPLSYPDISVSQQIRNELNRIVNNKNQNGSNNNSDSVHIQTNQPPHYSQVDNEDWMWTLSPSSNDDTLISNPVSTKTGQTIPTTISDNYSNNVTTSTFDDVLNNVQTFIAGSSTVKGIETKSSFKIDNDISSNENNINSTRVVIDSTMFMNLLHTTLKATSAEELSERLKLVHEQSDTNDPFFSQEDYDLMDPSDNDDFDDAGDLSDDNHVNIEEINMIDLMQVMDDELRHVSATSRAFDKIENLNVTGLINETDADDDIVRNAHVLSNLLKSLDAGGGAPGPIRNILHEMGGDVPLVQFDNEDQIHTD